MAREHLFWIGLEKGESVVVFAKGTSPGAGGHENESCVGTAFA